MEIISEVIKDANGLHFLYTRFSSKDDPCGTFPKGYGPQASHLAGLSVIHHPTNNCQLAIASNASFLFYDISATLKESNVFWPARTREDFLQILFAIYKATGKSLLLIDIAQMYHPKFRAWVDPKYIVMGSAYTSSNAHTMGVWIINIYRILSDEKSFKL